MQKGRKSETGAVNKKQQESALSRDAATEERTTDMDIPNEGKYVCKLNGQLVIYEASTGSLCGAVPCVVAAPPANEGFTFKHTMVLVKADGTIQTKATATLQAVFGWDGVDPFWLMDCSLDGGVMREAEFEIVGGPETGDKGGQYFKSQWLNPLGGGMKTPLAADRRSVLAKYGGKFHALASSATTGKSAREDARPTGAVQQQLPTAALKVPTALRAAQAPPPPGAPTATMDEAWSVLNESNPGKPAEAIEKIWFDTIAQLYPNKSNTDLKPHEWGKLKVEFADALPM